MGHSPYHGRRARAHVEAGAVGQQTRRGDMMQVGAAGWGGAGTGDDSLHSVPTGS